MKHLWIRFLPALTGLMLITSCHTHTANVDVHNPLYQTPELKKASDKITDNPKDATLYYDRGNMLHKVKKDSLAINDYKKAISIDSTKGEYYSAVGNLLFDHKDITASLPYIQRAIALNPADPKAHIKVAKMLLYLKKYNEAFAELNIVLRQNVHDPEPYFIKGLAYKGMRDTARAISSFLTALQEGPEDKEAMIQLGQMYSYRNNPIALKYFENAYRLDTNDVFPMYAIGVYYQNNKEFEKAKAAYKDCILHDNQYAGAYNNTGYILLQQDSLEKAWRQYNLVTQIDPANPAAYYSRGLCSELMNKKTDAIKDYKQALVFNAKDDEAKQGLRRLGGK
jgi:tetratricopeptide (TPR) repeat protein